MCVCAADGVQSSLHMVRYGVCVLWRGESSVDEVLEKVRELAGGEAGRRVSLVEITGGEPLLQPETPELAARLLAEGYTTMIETSGERFVGVLPREVIKIVDVKCPDSGEAETFDFANLEAIDQKDEIKFVISTRRDYEFARDFTGEHGLRGACARCCFRPCFLTRRGNGRGSKRANLRSGFWRTGCRCGWDCSCTNSSGIRR